MATIERAQLTQTRNVIVVGKTGCGKSTVANRLLGTGKNEFEVSHSLSSVTSKPSMQSCSFQHENVTYNLNVIDTIGLFDNRSLSNKAIMKATKEAIRKYVDGLHLIIFVLKDGRMTGEERKTFDIIHKTFAKDIQALSLLVVTGCELKDKPSVEREYRSSDFVKEIMKYMKKGVIAVGFPDLDQCSAGAIKTTYIEDGKKDEMKLRTLICTCETKYLEDKLYDDSWCTIV